MSPMMKLFNQLLHVLHATPLERSELGKISDGIAHGTKIHAFCQPTRYFVLPYVAREKGRSDVLTRSISASECEHVEEQKRNGHPTLSLVVRPVVIVQSDQNGNDDVRYGHAHATDQEERTTAVGVHGVERCRDADELRHV